MDGNLSESSANVQDTGYFKEAVCIDAMRVYDSCSEQQWSGYNSRNSKRGYSYYNLPIMLPSRNQFNILD